MLWLKPVMIVEEKRPVLARHARAAEWLRVWTDLGRAARTIDAYARGLAEFLKVCEDAGVDPVLASRADVAVFVRVLTSRTGRHGANVVSIDSGSGLANATLLQRLVPVRLFFDYLIEEGVRESNPVSRGRYTPGRRFGGQQRGLVPRPTKLPWIPSRPEWLALLTAFRGESARSRLMLALAYDVVDLVEGRAAGRVGGGVAAVLDAYHPAFVSDRSGPNGLGDPRDRRVRRSPAYRFHAAIDPSVRPRPGRQTRRRNAAHPRLARRDARRRGRRGNKPVSAAMSQPAPTGPGRWSPPVTRPRLRVVVQAEEAAAISELGLATLRRLKTGDPAASGPQRMLVGVPLTDDERAAVDNDHAAVDHLLQRLADVATPAGPTPNQLRAEPGRQLPLTVLRPTKT
jgi:hypothetical protein